MSIGDRITEERKRLRFTQAAFANKLGISLSSQKRYETNNGVPDLHYMAGLAELDVDVAYVMTGSRTPRERLRFLSGFERMSAELFALTALHLDVGGFADSVEAITAIEGTPEFLSLVIDALIENSPPLQERLGTKKIKSASAKKRIIK